MEKETKKIIWTIIISIVIGLLTASGFGYIIWSAEDTQSKLINCNELYPNLDSCELYKCRAENSNWIPNLNFNVRNYEICKIILNNNMSFNESLDLLNTITYDD